MKRYLLMFRTRTKLNYAASEIAKLKQKLPGDVKPVFFFSDGGALAFLSDEKADEIVFKLTGFNGDGPLSKFQDFALVEVADNWGVKFGFGPFHQWLARHLTRQAA